MHLLVPANNLSILFSEDIREEEGGKASVIGLFGGGLIVPSLPVTLPKLCITMIADVDHGDPMTVTCDVSSTIPMVLPKRFERVVETEKEDGEDAQWSLRIGLALVNFEIDKGCTLTVRFGAGDKTIERRLRINEGVQTETMFEKITSHLDDSK